MKILLNCLLLVVIIQSSNSLGRGAIPRHKQSIILDTDMDSKVEVDSNYEIQEHSSKCKAQCSMNKHQPWTAPKTQEFTTECCKKFKVLSSDQSTMINTGISLIQML